VHVELHDNFLSRKVNVIRERRRGEWIVIKYSNQVHINLHSPRKEFMRKDNDMTMVKHELLWKLSRKVSLFETIFIWPRVHFANGDGENPHSALGLWFNAQNMLLVHMERRYIFQEMKNWLFPCELIWV
jgi:hypothetical protein